MLKSSWFVAMMFIATIPLSASAQILVDGVPNIADDRMHSWLHIEDWVGDDRPAGTPRWPSRQGETGRGVWFAFGGGNRQLTLVDHENGLPAVRYVDVVSWTNVEDFGVLEESFTISIAATVRDPAFAYLFTGNQGGGGAEANANFFDDDLDFEFDVWTLKGNDTSFDRIYSAPVEVDVLQVHTFTFADEKAWHYINGELKAEGEVGFASLEGLVFGGRQNGNERASVDFSEALFFNQALGDVDRQAIEGYLIGRHIGGGGTPGDFDGDSLLTAADIDLLSAAVRAGSADLQFDLDENGAINAADRNFWIVDLKNTYPGDSNLDGEFNSSDFVFVFQRGQYEDGVAGNSGWADGDWNGDTEFDSSDFVTAFATGGFEQGPRAAVASVPEPGSLVMLAIGGLMLLSRRRR
jgi:hypothetical protein